MQIHNNTTPRAFREMNDTDKTTAMDAYAASWAALWGYDPHAYAKSVQAGIDAVTLANLPADWTVMTSSEDIANALGL